MYFHRPATLRMTAAWSGSDGLSPARAIDFTITVPFGYFAPTFFLLRRRSSRRCERMVARTS